MSKSTGRAQMSGAVIAGLARTNISKLGGVYDKSVMPDTERVEVPEPPVRKRCEECGNVIFSCYLCHKCETALARDYWEEDALINPETAHLIVSSGG